MDNMRGIDWRILKKTAPRQDLVRRAEFSAQLISQILKARQESGISQSELARRSGIQQSVISRLEHGGTDPKLSTLVEVLYALGQRIVIEPVETPQENKEKIPIPAV